MNDLILFLHTTVLSNYADDNNLYAIGNDKEETKRALVKEFQTVINWFYENYMILNTEKCHYMCLAFKFKFFVMLIKYLFINAATLLSSAMTILFSRILEDLLSLSF